MKKTMAASKRISVVIMVIVLTVVSCCGSVFAVYAGQPAEKEAGFVNISGDGGDDIVSLSASRVFRAYLPVDMTEEEAERTAETAEWSLVRNGESKYTDPDLYPNAWQGGSLDSLICMDGRNALFEEVATGAETKEGSVYLTLTFRNNDLTFTAWTAAPEHLTAMRLHIWDIADIFSCAPRLTGQNWAMCR